LEIVAGGIAEEERRQNYCCRREAREEESYTPLILGCVGRRRFPVNFCKIFMNVGELAHCKMSAKAFSKSNQIGAKTDCQLPDNREYRITDSLSPEASW
jgi:hypothetical protein